MITGQRENGVGSVMVFATCIAVNLQYNVLSIKIC